MKIGIISDIHEDYKSLEKAILLCERKGCNELVCLGDIVHLCIPTGNNLDLRNAEYCIDIVMTNCRISLAGNHDLFTLSRIPEFKAGFNYPPGWYTLEDRERRRIAGESIWIYDVPYNTARISNVHRQFLSGLPEYQIYTYKEVRILYSHYLFPDLSGSTTRWITLPGEADKHLKFMKEQGALLGISGHAHIEGALIGTKDQLKRRRFGTWELSKNEYQYVIGPCVESGKKKNGIMIFDPDSFVLELVGLD